MVQRRQQTPSGVHLFLAAQSARGLALRLRIMFKLSSYFAARDRDVVCIIGLFPIGSDTEKELLAQTAALSPKAVNDQPTFAAGDNSLT